MLKDIYYEQRERESGCVLVFAFVCVREGELHVRRLPDATDASSVSSAPESSDAVTVTVTVRFCCVALPRIRNS